MFHLSSATRGEIGGWGQAMGVITQTSALPLNESGGQDERPFVVAEWGATPNPLSDGGGER